MKIYIDKNAVGIRMYQKLETEFGSELIKDHLSSDTTMMVSMPFIVDEAKFKETPELSHIQLVTAGYDQMNLNLIKQNRIRLYNAKDVYSDTIAEDILTKIFVLNRNVKKYVNQMNEQTWIKHKNEHELYQKTVGFVGMGSITNATIKRLKGFDCTLIGYRKHQIIDERFKAVYTGLDGLDQVMKESDYVIITLPLNDETRGLINKDRLRHMKKDALLINIGRGEVINQDDLVELLKNESIRGVGLDVCYPEPLPKDHILWQLDNVYLTPHNAPSSIHQTTRLYELIKRNIQAYLNDDPMINEVIV